MSIFKNMEGKCLNMGINGTYKNDEPLSITDCNGMTTDERWSGDNINNSDVEAGYIYRIKYVDGDEEKCIQQSLESSWPDDDSKVILGDCDDRLSYYQKVNYNHTGKWDYYILGYILYSDNTSATLEGITTPKDMSLVNEGHTDQDWDQMCYEFVDFESIQQEGVDIEPETNCPSTVYCNPDIMKNFTAKCRVYCRFLKKNPGGENWSYEYRYALVQDGDTLKFTFLYTNDFTSDTSPEFTAPELIVVDFFGKSYNQDESLSQNDQFLKFGIENGDGTISYAKVDHDQTKEGMVLGDDPTIFRFINAEFGDLRWPNPNNFLQYYQHQANIKNNTFQAITMDDNSTSTSQVLYNYVNPQMKVMVNDSGQLVSTDSTPSSFVIEQRLLSEVLSEIQTNNNT